jgi:hypothetical protein
MASTRSPSTEMDVHEPNVQEDLSPRDSSSRDISDLEAGPTDEKHLSKSDVNQVNWETDDDSANPLNWGPSRKWGNLGVISIMSLATYIPTTPLIFCFKSQSES